MGDPCISKFLVEWDYSEYFLAKNNSAYHEVIGVETAMNFNPKANYLPDNLVDATDSCICSCFAVNEERIL